MHPVTHNPFSSTCSYLNLAAVSAITRPSPGGATVSEAKILTASGRVAPVHMVVDASRGDNGATVAVSTVEAYTSLSLRACLFAMEQHTWVRDWDAPARPFVKSGGLRGGLGDWSSVACNLFNGVVGRRLGESKSAPGDEEGGDQSLNRKHGVRDDVSWVEFNSL